MAPLFPSESGCLAKKCLTPEIFERLKTKQTNTGFTLEKAILSGVTHADSAIGIYAGDAQSNETFKPLFHPIIKAYHQIDEPTGHPELLMTFAS